MAPAVKIIGGDQAVYEHVDIRTGTAFGTTDTYNGVFAGNSQKALDLRTAVLLAWPREEIMEKIVRPINSSAQLMNSLMYFNAEPGYKDIIAKSGVSKFTEGTQASRNAKALALVKKYYPEATATNPVVKIKLLFGQPSNVRRVAEAALAKASVAQAGFDMDVAPTSGWSSFLESAKYDLSFFAWVKSALLQRGNVGTYQEQNYQGYSNPEIEKIYTELNGKLLTAAEIADRFLKVETILMRDAISLPIFQHPSVTGVTAKLMGVAPSPLSPNLVWNVWDWYFTA
jgi:peptide/nickel transport system substrate-binding protein